MPGHPPLVMRARATIAFNPGGFFLQKSSRLKTSANHRPNHNIELLAVWRRRILPANSFGGPMIKRKVSRRTALVGASVVLLATSRTAAAEDSPPVPGAPRSAFTKHSTADEVTQGLDLTGKTALITGSNSGIGFETMSVLAARGAHVLALARTKDKAAEACAAIKGKSTPFACEQTDFASVAACADAVKALGIPIDMLICNAGIRALPENERDVRYHT